jgi:hypothetical protein
MAIRQRNLEALHSVTMLAPTTVSAANDTTAIDCSAFDGDVCLILTAPASASATAMKVKVQAGEASDGSDAADVTGGAFPDLAAAAYHTRLVLSKDELPSRLRLRFFNETGTYSAAVSCVAVGIKKSRP